MQGVSKPGKALRYLRANGSKRTVLHSVCTAASLRQYQTVEPRYKSAGAGSACGPEAGARVGASRPGQRRPRARSRPGKMLSIR